MWMSLARMLHGLLDDQVHQPDDRRVPFLEGVGGRRSCRRPPPSSAKSIAVSVNSWSIESTDSVSDEALAVIFVDRLDDRFLGRQRDLDLAVQHEPQLVDRLEVQRVVHDDPDDPALLGQGHHDVFAGERLGDQFDDGGGDLDLVQLDEGQAVLFGLGLHDVVGVGVAQPDQGLLDRRRCEPAGFLELIGADHPAPDENLGPIPTLGHD